MLEGSSCLISFLAFLGIRFLVFFLTQPVVTLLGTKPENQKKFLDSQLPPCIFNHVYKLKRALKLLVKSLLI